MFPIIFHIGPFTLHTYGLMIAIGFFAGIHVAKTQFIRSQLPIQYLEKIVFALMLSGLLGARILYFAVSNFVELEADPLSFFRIWEGGLVFYGGVIAGLLTLQIYSVRLKLPYLSLTDAFAAPLLLGHAIGRWGCLAAGCCYGKPTDLPWGLVFKHPASLAPRFIALHPTQIYESIGTFFLFWGLLFLSKKNPRRGTLTSIYAMSYGILRFFIEFLRGDDRGLYHFGVSPSQLIALLLVLCGMVIFLYAKKEKTN